MRDQFEKSGYEVWSPKLPDADTPNRDVYWNFLTSQGWDFTGNVIVGHSSGATAALNLLASENFPPIKAAVLAGTFLNERFTKETDWYRPGQFDNLFPTEKFDFSFLKTRAEKFYFVHGDDDPLCSFEDAKIACQELGGSLITVSGGGHLSSRFGVAKLPQLVAELKQDSVL